MGYGTPEHSEYTPYEETIEQKKRRNKNRPIREWHNESNRYSGRNIKEQSTHVNKLSPLEQQYKELQQEKKLSKIGRKIHGKEIDEKYQQLKEQQIEAKKIRALKYSSVREQERELKEEKKYWEKERSLKGLQKSVDEERFRQRHPATARGRRVARAGYAKIQESYGQVSKSISRRGTSKLRSIASRFIGVGSSESPHTGLSTVTDEIVRGHIDPFQRSYFNESNQNDKQFFSSVETTPMSQRDLIGQGGRDMSSLINTAEQNLKKKEQRYY